MPEMAIGCAVIAGISAPHVLRLEWVAPARAAAIWLLALLLRALLAVGLMLFLVADLHGADPVVTVDDWHPQHALSMLSATLDVAVHPAAHLFALAPLLLIAGSLAYWGARLGRGWWLLRRLIGAAEEGGPLGTMLVPGDGVLVAVAGVGRSRILVSEGAAARLDPDELEAGVAHEKGHLRRLHRPVLLLGSLLGALAWILPGTRSARRRLGTSLECDADDYAVRQTADPLALASAICKVTVPLPSPATALRGSGSVTLRLERLLDEHEGRPGPVLEHASRSLIPLLGVVSVLWLELLVSLALLEPNIGHLLSPSLDSDR